LNPTHNHHPWLFSVVFATIEKKKVCLLLLLNISQISNGIKLHAKISKLKKNRPYIDDFIYLLSLFVTIRRFDMMRFLTLFIVLLFVIQRTFAINCKCSCCTSNGCTPQVIDTDHNLFFCGNTTCTPQKCIQWHYDECPPPGAFGVTKAECVSGNGSERLLSSLFIVFGITSLILMIKNKF